MVDMSRKSDISYVAILHHSHFKFAYRSETQLQFVSLLLGRFKAPGAKLRRLWCSIGIYYLYFRLDQYLLPLWKAEILNVLFLLPFACF